MFQFSLIGKKKSDLWLSISFKNTGYRKSWLHLAVNKLYKSKSKDGLDTNFCLKHGKEK